MPGWLRAVLFGVPPVVLLVVGILVLMPTMATCGGQSEVVTDLVKRCKRATDLLGADAHPARIGVACGQTENAGGNGTASWNLPYTGSRDRGTVSYDAIKRGGMWTVDRATLEVAGEAIDLVACAGVVRPPSVVSAPTLSQTNADDLSASLSGKVIRSTHPSLAGGTECTGALRRERGSPSAAVTVTCAGTVLYDGRGSFDLDVRDAARREDDHFEYEDTQGRCRVSAADGKGTLTVWSTAPAWELVVDL